MFVVFDVTSVTAMIRPCSFTLCGLTDQIVCLRTRIVIWRSVYRAVYRPSLTDRASPCLLCDQGWIEQMGVDRLPLGRHQPFFNVLAEDKSTRYAANGR